MSTLPQDRVVHVIKEDNRVVGYTEEGVHGKVNVFILNSELGNVAQGASLQGSTYNVAYFMLERGYPAVTVVDIADFADQQTLAEFDDTLRKKLAEAFGLSENFLISQSGLDNLNDPIVKSHLFANEHPMHYYKSVRYNAYALRCDYIDSLRDDDGSFDFARLCECERKFPKIKLHPHQQRMMDLIMSPSLLHGVPVGTPMFLVAKGRVSPPAESLTYDSEYNYIGDMESKYEDK